MKFNKKTTIDSMVNENPAITVNEAGGVAFKADKKTELFLRTAAFFFGEPKYYDAKDASTVYVSLVHDVCKTDPEFVLKLAVYARNTLYLRSTPLVLLAEYANSSSVGSVKNARAYVPRVVNRADEITELIAYQLNRNSVFVRKKKLPMMIKNGLADAFNKFDEYQFAKYNRDASVKLKDALFMCHPSPKDENQQILFDKIATDTLAVPDTWETIVSGCGSTPEAWNRAFGVMPYMALLRNVRNLVKNGVSVGDICARIEDKSAIRKSKQFPFRFYTVSREIEKARLNMDVSPILDSLNIALETSIDNVKPLGGRSFIAVDISGSMTMPVSNKSSVSCMDIATLCGALMKKVSPDSVVSAFANNFGIANVTKTGSILDNQKKIKSMQLGGSTNAYLAFEWLRDSKEKFDRVVLFSDMQCWDSTTLNLPGKSVYKPFLQYRRDVNKNTYLYSCDLSSYGTIQVPQDTPNLALIAGWSDRIFDYISLFERDRKTMLADIEAISVN